VKFYHSVKRKVVTSVSTRGYSPFQAGVIGRETGSVVYTRLYGDAVSETHARTHA